MFSGSALPFLWQKFFGLKIKKIYIYNKFILESGGSGSPLQTSFETSSTASSAVLLPFFSTLFLYR